MVNSLDELKTGTGIYYHDTRLIVTGVHKEKEHPYELVLAETGKHYGNWSLNEKDFPYITVIKGEGDNMLLQVKEYFQKNRDVVFTLVLLILIDKFVFNGAFTTKIKSTIEKLLDDTHQRIGK